MTEEIPPRPEPRLNQFDEEAAGWFARMRGPDAERHRADFERWLAQGALHRATYNRIAEIWVESAMLGKAVQAPPDRAEASRPHREHKRRRFTLGVGMFAVAASLALVVPPHIGLLGGERSTGPGAAIDYATAVGEVRRIRLPDRSIVTLDTDSLMTFNHWRAARSVRLIQGRARFAVARNARPFVVQAGPRTVIARNAVFDVSLDPGSTVRVEPLSGVVVVWPKGRGGQPGATAIEISPGQEFRAESDIGRPVAIRAHAPTDWPNGNLDVSNARLAEVVAQANRYGTIKIVLMSSELADLRISGTFRVDDPDQLATVLTSLFDLVIRRDTSEIRLSRK